MLVLLLAGPPALTALPLIATHTVDDDYAPLLSGNASYHHYYNSTSPTPTPTYRNSSHHGNLTSPTPPCRTGNLTNSTSNYTVMATPIPTRLAGVGYSQKDDRAPPDTSNGKTIALAVVITVAALFLISWLAWGCCIGD